MCCHWRWNPKQGPVRPSGQPQAALVQLLGMPVVPQRYFRNLVTFFHTLILKRNCQSFRQRCTCTPAKSAGHSTPRLSFHWALFTAIGMLGARGIVGNLIHGISLLHGWPHQRLTACNTASEASVLTFLQHWLCDPSYQREEIKYSKKEQILKEQCFEIVARRTVLYICLLRDSGCGQLSARKRESIPKLSAQFWDIF